ncbi:MAG: hypothetical protein KKI09_10685 [Spirochaetes bacterium]|nr:hypothetical protein [Spirochaetota bacterium]MBU0955884.1 hypothetical protein [Spirochaetota bacterium]
MRKIAVVTVLALGLVFQSAANDAARVLGFILMSAETVDQQYAATLSLVSFGEAAGAEYVFDSLERVLAARSTIRLGGQMENYERLIRLQAKALGDWRYTNAAPALWRVVEDSKDPLTRAEALIALGGLRATEYGERISLMLRDLNARPAQDIESGEKLAYAAILALERMGYPGGFSSVFFAVDAWYSRRIKDQAVRSLPLVLADPSEELLTILRLESNPRRLRALQYAVASNLPPARKIEIAAYALNIGLTNVPSDRIEYATVATMRKLALNALVELGDRSGNSAIDFANAFRLAELNNDIDERLLVLRAMGADRSLESARELAAIITRLNEDQKAGRVNDERNRLMQAALQNAAISANKELFAALQLVKINEGWSNTIIRLANTALAALQ